MAITKIEPNEWKVFIECPNCHREREMTSQIRTEGRHKYMKIGIPKYCIYCEEEKKN